MNCELSLAELEPFAGALLAVLLALLHTRVARQQPFGLQCLPQFRIELNQGARHAHLHGVSLRGHPAAAHVRGYIEIRCHLRHRKRLLRRNPLLLGHEMLIELLAVDLPLTRARAKKAARNRRLAPPRAVILNQIRHCSPKLSRACSRSLSVTTPPAAAPGGDACLRDKPSAWCPLP